MLLTDCLYRIAEIEDKIGAGLIEEVLQVAEGELGLVDEMIASRMYASSTPQGYFIWYANGDTDGSHWKKRPLQASGLTLREAPTRALHRASWPIRSMILYICLFFSTFTCNSTTLPHKIHLHASMIMSLLAWRIAIIVDLTG